MRKHRLISLGITVCVFVYAVAAADPEVSELQSLTADGALGGTGSRQESDATVKLRLQWNLATLLGGYYRVGNRKPAWDANAREALKQFAQLRARSGDATRIQASFEKAVRAAAITGCDDPLIQYLAARYVGGPAAQATRENVGIHTNAAQNMIISRYADIWKFHAGLHAAEALVSAYRTANYMHPETHWFRRAAAANLLVALGDKNMPFGEVEEACVQLMDAVDRNDRQAEEFYFRIEKALLGNWPDEAGAQLIKGTFYVKYAWIARGTGFSNTVTPEGWKLFNERLAVAEEALEKAWSLDPGRERIALEMMRVELGQGKGRERMETWFNRAMKLNPNSYEACWRKLYYLEPKWRGSPAEMLEFGRKCLESKEWGGGVPLILAAAHSALAQYVEGDLKTAYWQHPRVWADGQASFEKFFRRYPNAVNLRKNYASYAYFCEQWDELNRQLAYIRPVDHAYFGGTAEYEKIVQTARAKGATKAP